MKATRINVVGKALGTWLAILAFVAFLTFAFNFLGTILCAVVIGMMMGGGRYSKGQIIPVSLIFPVVILIMLGLIKTDLVRDKLGVVAGLCFGAFWLTYALTHTVRVVEAQQKSHTQGAEMRATASVVGLDSASALELAAETAVPASTRKPELDLAMLQGSWVGESPGESLWRRRAIEITADQIALKVFTGEGRVCWEARGELRLDHSTCTIRPLLPAPDEIHPDAFRANI